MRAVVLLVIAACSAAPRPFNPAATRSIRMSGDVVVRGEADGFVSVMTSAMLDDVTAFGVVLLSPAGDGVTSPHVVVARARAWHALSMMVTPNRSVEAATRGVALLPACGRD